MLTVIFVSFQGYKSRYQLSKTTFYIDSRSTLAQLISMILLVLFKGGSYKGIRFVFYSCKILKEMQFGSLKETPYSLIYKRSTLWPSVLQENIPHIQIVRQPH